MAVQKVCDEFWSWRLKESPEFATFCGVHDYDDQLDDTSIEGYERRGVSSLKFCTIKMYKLAWSNNTS